MEIEKYDFFENILSRICLYENIVVNTFYVF